MLALTEITMLPSESLTVIRCRDARSKVRPEGNDVAIHCNIPSMALRSRIEGSVGPTLIGVHLEFEMSV